MADLETIRILRVKGTTEGMDEVTRALERVGKAYEIVGNSAGTAGVQSDTSAKKVLSASREMASLAARLDPAEAAAQKFARGLNTIARAAESGYFNKFVDGADRLEKKIVSLQREFEKLGASSSKGAAGGSSGEAEASFRAMEDLYRAKATQIGTEFARELNERIVEGSGKAARDSAAAFQENWSAQSNAQQAFNAQIGVKPWQAQGSQASQSASAFMDADAESAQRLTTEYDQLTAAVQRRDAAIAKANELLARGAIEEQQHVRIVAGVNRVYDDTERALKRTGVSADKYSNSMGLARHEMINFSRQMQDVFVSLTSGQAPMTVLIQQGTQIADIFSTSNASAGGFFTQLAGGAARFATSLAGITTLVAGLGAGLAAAGYRWASSQREIEVSLMGIGRGSGQTVQSINAIADAAAKAGSISRSAGREIASTFAGTGQIDKSLINNNLVDTMSRGYGVLTNKGQTDAAKELAGALASPTAGAQELEKRIGKLSDAQMEFIRTSEASGNKLEAQRALLNAVNEPLSVAAARVGLFARAWEAVSKAASDAADAVGKVVNGPDLDQRIAGLQKLIENRSQYGYRQGSIAQAEAQLAPLLRERRTRNEIAENNRYDAASSNLSRQAGGIARGVTTDLSRRLGIEEQLSVLEKAFGDSSAMKKLGPTADLVAGSIEKLRSSLANFETEAERIARDFQLQAQSIDAYTLTQKAAVEAERARTEAIRAGRGEVQAGVEAEQARTRTIMEANRQLRDTARDLKDAGSLIGLSPYQRSLRENANATRRESETLTMGGSSSGGNLTRDQKLDLIEKYESGGRNIKQQIVPEGGGYNPSVGRVTGPSSAQGNFQITNPTWRDGARMAGVDLGQYPNAMSAPYATQRQVAGALLDNRGMSPWAPYNANLRGALAGQGVGAANDNGAARNANTMKEAYEGWNTPLASANRNLDQNIALQQRAKETFAQTTAQVTEASERQRLLNEYMQQGIPITEGLAAGIDAYAKRAGQAAQAAEDWGKSVEAMRTVGDLGRDTIKGFVSDLRNGASGADMFRNALDRIASKLLDMALNDLFGKAFGNNSQGLFGGGGFFSGIGNFFGGFGGGGGYNFGGTAGGNYSMGAGGYSGAGPFFADGGFTGHGSKWQPAGTVHKGEVVWSQRDVANAGGVGVVEAMRRGLPGYANGGPVAVRPPMPANYNGANRNSTQVNVYNAVGGEVSTETRDDGSVDVYINRIEANMSRKMVQGKGSLGLAVRQVTNNQNLRG